MKTDQRKRAQSASITDDFTPAFSYDAAFSRNLGWVTGCEQQVLRFKKIAIAGMGGVGGAHLLTLARLGIGAFHIADFDRFDVVNFNRQVGATSGTIGRPKVDAMAEMALDINPEMRITKFPEGVNDDNLDAFLDGVDLFVDGLDFFVLDVRAKVFARCADRGIPAITAAPIGMGAGYLIFMPGGMTFEEWFRLDGLPEDRRYVNFLVGLTPKAFHRPYLVEHGHVDLAGRRGPSTGMACQLCAGVVGVEALKILLGRSPVRAVPYYHHFDAYRGRWKVGRLRGGNRHPLQALKLSIGYRLYTRMAQAPAAGDDDPSPRSELEQILNLARWAPSGDNTQPWRFRIVDGETVHIQIGTESADDIYDYDGKPTLLSAGMLLETMRIAASHYGRTLSWRYEGPTERGHAITAHMPKTAGTTPDPLLAQVTARSVDRRPYRTTPLTERQKQSLEAAIGDELELRWHEAVGERWRVTRLNARATDIRLRIPEAFRVHQRVLDWTRPQSPGGMPVAALGLDPVTRRLMRWAMAGWRRMDRLNRLPGATAVARCEMDVLPGLLCAAHFAVTRKGAATDGEAPAHLRAGAALQRFWLTATALGLAMQPSLATLIFAHYGRTGARFTEHPRRRSAAVDLNAEAGRAYDWEPGALIFTGRIGRPRRSGPSPRSVRLPLSTLIESGEAD